MMNKYILTFIFTPFLLFAGFSNYSPELKTAIRAVEQLEEVEQMLQDVEAVIGPIRVVLRPHPTKFEAIWDPKNNTIILNKRLHQTLGQNICSIIFELHNAKATGRLTEVSRLASRGLLSKNEYIETMERIEHLNAVNTKRLLEKGIGMGIFPKNARWNIPDNFDVHLAIQKRSGHSAWFSKLYDQLSDPHLKRYNEMSPKERRALTELVIDYLVLKEKIDFSSANDREIAMTELENRWKSIETYKMRRVNQPHLERKHELIKNIFINELKGIDTN